MANEAVANERTPQFMPGLAEHIIFGPDAVPALLVRPQPTDSQTLGLRPAALVQHGYGADKSDFLPLAAFLAMYGFVTLLPDAWEHGERLPQSGPTWQNHQSTDYFLDVVRHTIADMGHALTWLAEQPDIRSDAIVVGGFSMGAMAALILGAEDPRPAGVISVSGASLPDLANTTRMGPHAPSAENAQWAQEHDAARHIARLSPRPLLLQHGRHDDMAPVESSLRLHSAALPAYAEHPDRLTLMLYDHGHTVTERQMQDALNWVATIFSDTAA